MKLWPLIAAAPHTNTAQGQAAGKRVHWKADWKSVISFPFIGELQYLPLNVRESCLGIQINAFHMGQDGETELLFAETWDRYQFNQKELFSREHDIKLPLFQSAEIYESKKFSGGETTGSKTVVQLPEMLFSPV